jgi:hypothetical protein
MTGDSFDLAQVNIGPDARAAGADRAPGFGRRLQTEDGDATTMRIFDDGPDRPGRRRWLRKVTRVVNLHTIGLTERDEPSRQLPIGELSNSEE